MSEPARRPRDVLLDVVVSLTIVVLAGSGLLVVDVVGVPEAIALGCLEGPCGPAVTVAVFVVPASLILVQTVALVAGAWRGIALTADDYRAWPRAVIGILFALGASVLVAGVALLVLTILS